MSRPRQVPQITAATAGIPARSVLWVMGVGVSTYQDRNLNLQFAEADARAITAAFAGQAPGPLYREVKTLVLTDQGVTRESVLNGMEKFLGGAGPDDIVVIFLAGHGIQDRASGSYYFLPYPATTDTLLTAALRMTDFDEMVRILRRNVRGVVLMFDTCHAGGLRLPAANLAAADDLATRMSAGEGFFLLAAAKPGEDSKEEPQLGHGAFTYALLEGLGGAADGDGDGMLTVSDLFGYVARQVPRLTDGAQHPYHKVEGTDLVLATVLGAAVTVATAGALPRAFTPPPLPATPVVNSIGVMEFRGLRADPEHDWIGKAVRVALNTELSKVRALRVFSPELIDRTLEGQHADYLGAARRLGIRKLLTGSFHVVGDGVRVDADIVDTATGVQEASDSVQGNLSDFFELQKNLVFRMLRRLRVEVSAQEGESIQTQSNTNVDAYRLLLESEGLVDERATPTGGAAGTPSPLSFLFDRLSPLAMGVISSAYAAEPDAASDPEVRALLEQYRRALERKDLDQLASLYQVFPARQREALRVYLDNANDLTVTFADVVIEARLDGVAVSYTRRDRFVDSKSGKAQQLEVRLTKILVRENGQWKITGR